MEAVPLNAPKSNFKTILIALLVVLLAVNTVQLVQVKDELRHLRNDYTSMYNTINNRVNNVQNTLNHQTNEIREILDEQEALFASTDVDVSYQDRKLTVTISAVPKELKSNETLWASLAVNGETITQQFDASGKAVIPLEATAASFVPTVQIKSPTGVKQQVLDEVSTMEFRVHAHSAPQEYRNIICNIGVYYVSKLHTGNVFKQNVLHARNMAVFHITQCL